MSEHKTIKWLDKLKQVKHIEIYIAIIFIVVVLLIYLSNGSHTKKETSKNSASELTITSYVDNLESDLASILSNIEGVSNVKVMITLDMQQVGVSDSQLMYDSFPKIKGIIVTASGVGNTSNRMKVLHALEAVVDVTNGNIQILSSD